MVSKNSQHLWLIVLASTVLFDLAAPILLGSYYPGYSHLFDTISSLGTEVSPVKTFAGWSLIVTGGLFVIFSFGQRSLFMKMGNNERLYFWGILLFGAGTIFAGVFPEDPKGTEIESVNAKIHGIASFVGFVGLILCPLWAIRIKQISTPFWANRIFLWSGFLSFVLFLFSGEATMIDIPQTGLIQRINLVLLYSGLIVNLINCRQPD